MPSIGEIVTVVIDGYALQGWQQVSVTRAAGAAAISFSLEATNPGWSDQAFQLRRGKLVEIYTTPVAEDAGSGRFSGGDLLCKGYIDEYESEGGEGDKRAVGVSGRSKAGDAIDCPPAKHKTGRVENKTLKGVAEEFDEWDIGFSADVPLRKLAEVQIVPGESVFKVLEREARHLGVLLTGQPDGSVKITRAGKDRHAGGLVEGQQPLRSWKVRFSMKNKRSPIIVRGQRSLGTGAKNLRQEERAEDETVGRNRPFILFHEGSGTSKELKRRAEWERLRRSGSGVSVHAKVSTWRDADGKLWAPGQIVAVKIPTEELDQDLAVKTVTFGQAVGEGSGAGTWADLELVDPRTLGGKASGGAGKDNSKDYGAGNELGDDGQEAEDEL